MGRPPKTPWNRIFADLDKGHSKTDVCARYGVSRSTLYRKIRERPDQPASGTHRDTQAGTRRHTNKPEPAERTLLAFPSQPTRRPARQRETREERGRRMADARRAEREQAKIKQRAEALNGFDKGVIRDTMSRLQARVHSGLQCPTCDGDDAEPLDSRSIRDYSNAFLSYVKELGAVLAAESQFTADEDTGPDLDSPEGRQQIADRLNDDPALLSLCDVDTLEAALAMARRKQA